MSGLNLVTLIVPSYDPAIAFFTQILGFTLLEDKPALTNDGRPKRWVVVHPPAQTPAPSGTPATGGEAGGSRQARAGGASILLAQADGPEQLSIVGRQFSGRVGFFWSVEDFWGTYERLKGSGVEFVTEPRREEYGLVVVFLDCVGNKWDLLGPRTKE
ncbi:Glyoxalase/Bleomycin resistance protein/Dihydroxybiphenyl dioxygenase [Aspergillus granulosus]|uniref:Glyoxalase/Bleomycin resistance protein/Dihydroxybiphenyl dioxygenase n=1 Tax=Aspergillus granulosus TaxID=176169 RepID=A0ABR4HVG9_9EURO